MGTTETNAWLDFSATPPAALGNGARQVIEPATGEVLCTVGIANAADVAKATAAAAIAQARWVMVHPREKAEIFRRAATLFQQHFDTLSLFVARAWSSSVPASLASRLRMCSTPARQMGGELGAGHETPALIQCDQNRALRHGAGQKLGLGGHAGVLLVFHLLLVERAKRSFTDLTNTGEGGEMLLFLLAERFLAVIRAPDLRPAPSRCPRIRPRSPRRRPALAPQHTKKPHRPAACQPAFWILPPAPGGTPCAQRRARVQRPETRQ